MSSFLPGCALREKRPGLAPFESVRATARPERRAEREPPPVARAVSSSDVRPELPPLPSSSSGPVPLPSSSSLVASLSCAAASAAAEGPFMLDAGAADITSASKAEGGSDGGAGGSGGT